MGTCYTLSVATSVGLQVSHVAQALSLTNERMAALLGASPRSVQRWIRGDGVPRATSLQRLYELTAVSDLLEKVMKPDGAAMWLQQPNPLLGGRTPAQRIAEGGYRDILGLVQALGEGVVV